MTGPGGAMVRKRVIVSGLVQGVFFRDRCRQIADSRGVTGWVRNRPDGTVEAVFEGEPAQVDELVRWAYHGPGEAMVEQVVVHEESPEGLRGFAVTG